MPNTRSRSSFRSFSRLMSLALLGFLGLAACSEKEKAPEVLDDAALPMSPAPGDLLPSRLPGFTLEQTTAITNRSAVRDNLIALARPVGQPDGDPALTVALGRIDGASIQYKWAEMFDGFEKPALKLTRRVHTVNVHARAVRAGDVIDPQANGGSKSVLWFRYYRDVPVMLFASDEETGKRFIDQLCQYWEGQKLAPTAEGK